MAAVLVIDRIDADPAATRPVNYHGGPYRQPLIWPLTRPNDTIPTVLRFSEPEQVLDLMVTFTLTYTQHPWTQPGSRYMLTGQGPNGTIIESEVGNLRPSNMQATAWNFRILIPHSVTVAFSEGKAWRWSITHHAPVGTQQFMPQPTVYSRSRTRLELYLYAGHMDDLFYSSGRGIDIRLLRMLVPSRNIIYTPRLNWPALYRWIVERTWNHGSSVRPRLQYDTFDGDAYFLLPINARGPVPHGQDADSQDADSQDADSQDADSQDADSQDADSQDADSQDADSQDADSQDADSQDIDSQDEDGQDVEQECYDLDAWLEKTWGLCNCLDINVFVSIACRLLGLDDDGFTSLVRTRIVKSRPWGYLRPGTLFGWPAYRRCNNPFFRADKHDAIVNQFDENREEFNIHFFVEALLDGRMVVLDACHSVGRAPAGLGMGTRGRVAHHFNTTEADPPFTPYSRPPQFFDGQVDIVTLVDPMGPP